MFFLLGYNKHFKGSACLLGVYVFKVYRFNNNTISNKYNV